MKLLRLVLVLISSWIWLSAFSLPAAHADAPAFASNAVSVDKNVTYLLDTVLYTIKLDNTSGTADALDVTFTDTLPRGIDVQLFSLDGIPQALTLLSDGLYVGTIAAGTSRTITILGVVNAIPIRPAPAQYTNGASWTYRYRPTPTSPKVNASFSTNSVTTNVVRLETSMAIATVALAPILNLGTEITYTLTVQNTGNINTSGATLTNAIPVGALYRAGSTTLNGTTLPDLAAAGPFVLGNTINSPGRPAGQINAGETATIVFKVTSLTLPVINLAVVDADGTLGPVPPLNVRGTTQAQALSADLSLTQTDGQTSAIPGTFITYTLTVKNNGGATLDTVQVVDDVPATLLNPSWTANTGTYTPASGAWTDLSLASGQTITLTLKAKISPFATGNLTNTATVSPPAGVSDSNTANNSATDTDTLTPTSDLAVAQMDGVDSVTPGATHVYTIMVSNNGPSAVTSLTLNDTLPASLQNPTFSPEEGTYNPSTGAWTGLSLPPSQNVKLTLSGTISPSATGTVVNTVSISPPSGTTDPTSANNATTDTNSVLVPSSQRLALLQSVDKALAKPGEVITYTVTYRNSSSQGLAGVGIRNAIPINTTFVGASYGTLPAGISGCVITGPAVGSGGTVSWDFGGMLSPGQSGQITFQVRIK